MNYISNYKLFVEKQITLNVSPNPIEGGVVLILSKPFPDGNKKLIMRIIDKVRDVESGISVNLKSDLFILKEFDNGAIMPEGLYLTDEQRMNLLGMKSNSLFLNRNKTPLWTTSTSMNPKQFFKNYQDALHQLRNEKDFVYPKTQRTLPNL